MLAEYKNLQLKVNEDLKQLELNIDGYAAFIKYKISGDRLFLIHTEAPIELQGKGAGSAIVEKAMEYAGDKGYKIVPLCPFVRAYLKRHPEWNDLIDENAARFIN